MPSGRLLPSAFGMYTRRTGRASQGCDMDCTHAANSARAVEVNTTCPSTPAVARPALRCVTRRTLTSVLARLRSINFCRFRTRFRSPSCDALKIRCRSRRTRSSTARQSMASQSRTASSGPFTMSVSNVPFGSSTTNIEAAKAHPVHVSTLSGRAPRPVSGQLSAPTVKIRPAARLPAAFRRAGVRFLDHPVPATDVSFPHGRPTRTRSWTLTGFPRSACARPDREGCLLNPGATVLTPPVK